MDKHEGVATQIARLTAERDDMMRLYRLEHERHTKTLAALLKAEALIETLTRQSHSA